MSHHIPLEKSAKSLNNALLALYESRLPEINDQINYCIGQCGWQLDKISKTFFMSVDDAYVNAPKRILFVGRETFGWDTYNRDDKASELMSFYQKVSSSGEHHNSPFWWFREGMSKALNINNDTFMRATMWTNLSKIDLNKAKPTGKPFDVLMQTFINLLVAEIEIIKPDIILILTKDGFYNWHLNYYRWDVNEQFRSYDDGVSLQRKPIPLSKIQRLITPNGLLPFHTYQVCHPNVLRRRGNYTNEANEIIRQLEQQLTS